MSKLFTEKSIIAKFLEVHPEYSDEKENQIEVKELMHNKCWIVFLYKPHKEKWHIQKTYYSCKAVEDELEFIKREITIEKDGREN